MAYLGAYFSLAESSTVSGVPRKSPVFESVLSCWDQQLGCIVL